MDFMKAAQLLDEGYALKRNSWTNSGYITKDKEGIISFFDHNEPTVYQLSTEDALAGDWESVAKDRWTIVSIAHDHELMQGKLFVTYHICAQNGGSILNNHLVEQDQLAQWSHYVQLDMDETARYLNEQDIENVQNTLSA
ncbi:hypothetical protein [Halobacillus litoralis]|uniref:Thoeris anti-defense Tad2 family protein n=1 Tax=Halobacillus litoralis TaxID=45668 RepID=UPI001CFE91D5|nr:hypothetical protein [Halobacillus litoralis]